MHRAVQLPLDPIVRAELGVTIAGITTRVLSRQPDLTLKADGALAPFVTPAGTPDIRLEVDWRMPPDALGEKMFDSGGVWQLFRYDDRFVFHLRSPKFGNSPYRAATMAPDFGSGVIHLRRDCFDRSCPVYPLEYPLDELVITNWLGRGRGVEVHACAVVDRNGDGYLFVGHSGAGKTTMARQWCDEPGVSVLSDDRVILRKAEGRIWMHGTPWHGDEPLASRERAPLTRVFFLRHESRNELAAIPAPHAVAELFARSFPPPYSAAAIDFTLAFLGDVAERVPIFELGFSPDASVREIVRVAA